MRTIIVLRTLICSLFICVLHTAAFAQPSNDACAGATSITPSASCTPLTYNIKNAASEGAAGSCGGATATSTYDMWFKFTTSATATAVTITLSSPGNNLTLNTMYVEVFKNGSTCATLSNPVCTDASSTIAVTGLSVSTTYFFRVYVTANPNASGSASKYDYGMCVQYPSAPSNDNCSGAQTLTSSTTCSTTSSTLNWTTPTSGVPAGCTAGTHYDAWFSFTALHSTEYINLSNLGSYFTNPEIQLFSGTCAGGLTSIACASGTSLTATGLTTSPATIYFVRVSNVGADPSGTGSVANFNICVTHPPPPPANDDCNGAVTLTSASSCSSTSGTLNMATISAGAPAGCSAGSHYDVWYKFTATSTFQLVSLSSVGANITNPEIQLFSGTCAGGLTSLQCGSGTTLSANGLTVGTVYYVRVSNVGTDPSGAGSLADFSICVTSPPANDNCAGAVSLTSNSGCTTTSSTIIGATASAGVPAGCSASTPYDVWFSFSAVKPLTNVTLSGLGKNFKNPEIQLFSGTCGSLTSLFCSTGSTLAASGLTPGTVYYVRVSSPTAVTTLGNFSICITHLNPTPSNIDYSKSYVNITKGTGGGTVSPGDTLEIRATFVVRSGAASTVDSLAFYDTLYVGRGLALVPGSMAWRTNEGKIYGNGGLNFTDGVDGDVAHIEQTTSLDTAIQINIGANATNYARGRLTNTSRPSVFGNTCIIMATYRVVVYAGYNSTVNVGGGAITLRDANTTAYSNLAFSPTKVMVYQSPGLCPDAVSATNAIGGDFNGTFGMPSGGAPLAKNRGISSNVPGYTYNTFTSGSPGDYYYGITNNTSGAGANYSTLNTWAKPDNSASTHRVFNVWDISGDHTGASNPALGNPACDTTKPVSPTNPCGYMLVINSAYKTDTAFRYTISNLCQNTNYEIAAWFKNICSKCSCDSTGKGASTAGYLPFAPGDSSGVQPNLAFDIDGIDFYTTGNIAYNGNLASPAGSDSTNKWVKRGFTYLTAPGQTSLTLTIRNNAPGGGGNDWAMDDISVATCLPTMKYSPSLSPDVCANSIININDTVRSYFNTYQNYQWQRSTDNGSTWTDISGATGTAAPVLEGAEWKYITSYTVPPANSTLSNSGDRYRVLVASAASNLSNSSCQVTDGVSIISLNVLDCGTPLNTDLLSFNGKLANNNAHLSWITSREMEPLVFTMEKSLDGIHFNRIGTRNSYRNHAALNNNYSFIDSAAGYEKIFYRLAMSDEKGRTKYSRTIQLGNHTEEFNLNVTTNPFDREVLFDVIVNKDAKIEALLLNAVGNVMKQKTLTAATGINKFSLQNTGSLRPGIYILQVQYQGQTLSRKLIKK